MNKKLTLLILTFSFCLVSSMGISQITSAGSGNWSAPGTWVGGVVPGSANDVIIAATHVVAVDDATASCKNIGFGAATSKINFATAASVLSVYGDFTLFSTTHNAFSAWTAGAKIKFTGTAPTQVLSGWNTVSGTSTAFMEMIVDKPVGAKVVTAGNNMRFSFGTSMEILSGTFELANTDDIQTKNIGGTGTAATILIQPAGTFNMAGNATSNSSYIRRGTFTGDETAKIGKMTIFGKAYFSSSSTSLINLGGIDIENNGLVEFLTNQGTATNIFNPGIVTVKSGGEFKNNLTTSYWYVNTLSPNTVLVDGGEFNFAGINNTLPQVFSITSNISSTVRYSGSGNQILPTNITAYQNLILSNANTKTLGVNTIVNGILSLRGTATFSQGAFALTYGSTSTLQYGSSGQTSAQIASSAEWPASGGPTNITIFNSGGVTMPASFSRTFSGVTTLTQGTLNLGSTTHTLSGTITRTTGNINAANAGLNVFTSSNLNIPTGTFLSGNIAAMSAFPSAGVSISFNDNISIGSLYLDNGMINIGSYTLSLPGNNTISGTLTGSATSSLLTGDLSSPLNFTSGSGVLKNFTVNGAVTLGNALSITAGANAGTVVVNSGAVLTTAGLLTLRSDANGTARVGNTAGAISGNVVVERFIPAGMRAYRQLSTGVIPSTNIFNSWQNSGVATAGAGIHITGSGTNGTDATQTGNPNLFTYTPGGATFTPVLTTNGVGDVLNPLRGYRVFIYGDRNADLTMSNNGSNPANNNIALNSNVTLSSTGTLITGTVVYTAGGASINGGAADNTAALGSSIGDYSLIGNPFRSPVDFDAMAKANIANSYYIWDPTIGKRGQYVSWTTGSGSSLGSSAITKDIQPGQAIFVQTSAANPSLTYAEANKSSGNTNTFRTPAETPSKLRVYLVDQSTGNTIVDGTTAAFRDDFSSAIGAEDANKFANGDENIAIIRTGTLLGLEGRPTVISNDTVAIRIWKLYATNNYSLRIDGNDFDAGIMAFLEDKLLNQVHPLNTSGSFPLPFSFNNADSSSFYNRFQVVFKPATVLPVGVNSVRAFERNSGVQVEWKNSSESNMDHYEVERSAEGLRFTKIATVAATSNNSSAASYNFFDATPISGDNYYRIKAVGRSGEEKYSAIVKLAFGKPGTFVTVYPNPVKDSRFTVQLNNLPKGEYRLAISNAAGQQVYSQVIINQNNSVSETIDLKQQKLVTGIYTLTVTATGGSVLSTQQLIINN